MSRLSKIPVFDHHFDRNRVRLSILTDQNLLIFWNWIYGTSSEIDVSQWRQLISGAHCVSLASEIRHKINQILSICEITCVSLPCWRFDHLGPVFIDFSGSRESYEVFRIFGGEGWSGGTQNWSYFCCRVSNSPELACTTLTSPVTLELEFPLDDTISHGRNLYSLFLSHQKVWSHKI